MGKDVLASTYKTICTFLISLYKITAMHIMVVCWKSTGAMSLDTINRGHYTVQHHLKLATGMEREFTNIH